MRYEMEYNKEDSFKVLGLLVKFHRVNNGFSLRDLGQLSNISHTLISNVENGKVISNDETLKDLFRVLKIEFQNKEEIFDEFKIIYESLFASLNNFEYDKATEIFNKMERRSSIYANSNVLVEYHLIKYLYLAILDKFYGTDEEEYASLRIIATNLTQKQHQLYHYVHGVYLIGKGRFLEASEELEHALKIGDSGLDPFIKVYLIRTYVKMYRFMDAHRLSRETIPVFENDLNYTRAMEIRVIISYSFILVKKYEEAKQLLEKVYRFTKNYSVPYLLDECNLYYGIIFVQTEELAKAKEKFDAINNVLPVAMLYRTMLAIKEQDYYQVEIIYNTYKELNFKKPNESLMCAFEILASSFHVVSYSETQYHDVLEEYLAYGLRGCDIEIVEIAYGLLIEYYKSRRLYKQALEASENAREIRRFGCLKQ